jgi:hypothetical protein
MITVINQPPVVCLSENPAIMLIETDIDSGENLHIVVEPKYYNRLVAIGSDVLYPPYEGRAECDLSEYLRSAFGDQVAISDHFLYPESSIARMLEDQSLRYSIKIREGIGFPAVYTDTTIADRYVVPGQIPKWIRNSFYKNYDSFWDWIQTVHPFLTLQPDNQKTTLAQTRKLYWMMWYDPATQHNLKLNIHLQFTDGTDGDWVRSTVPEEDWNQYAIYEISVGYTGLGIAAKITADYPGKTLQSYTLSLVADEGAAVSESRTFIIDRTQHDAEREFVFRNSVGGYDTFMFTGTGEAQRDHSNESVKVNNTTHGLATKRALFADVDETMKVSSGWLTPAERLYLSELYNSTEVYEITTSGLMPIVIKKQGIISEKDNDTLIAHQLEYERVVNYYFENGI